MRIFFKVVIIVFTVILFFNAILAFLFIKKVEKVMNVKDNDILIEKSKNIESKLRIYFESKIELIEAISKNSDLINYILDYKNNNKPSYEKKDYFYSNVFSELEKSINSLYKINILSKDGTVIMSNMVNEIESLNLLKYDIIQNTLNSTNRVVFNNYELIEGTDNKNSENFLFSFAKAITIKDYGIIGFLIIYIKSKPFLDKEFNDVFSSEKNSDGFIYLLNSNGDIIYHPYSKINELNIKSENKTQCTQETYSITKMEFNIQNGKQIFKVLCFTEKTSDIEIYVKSSKIDNINFFNNIIFNAVLISVISILCISILVLSFINKYIKIKNSFLSYLNKILSGDLRDNINNNLYSKDGEIGEFAIALNGIKDEITHLIVNSKNVSFKINENNSYFKENFLYMLAEYKNQKAQVRETSKSIDILGDVLSEFKDISKDLWLTIESEGTIAQEQDLINYIFENSSEIIPKLYLILEITNNLNDLIAKDLTQASSIEIKRLVDRLLKLSNETYSSSNKQFKNSEKLKVILNEAISEIKKITSFIRKVSYISENQNESLAQIKSFIAIMENYYIEKNENSINEFMSKLDLIESSLNNYITTLGKYSINKDN